MSRGQWCVATFSMACIVCGFWAAFTHPFHLWPTWDGIAWILMVLALGSAVALYIDADWRPHR